MSNYNVPKGWKLVPEEPTQEMLVAINWPNDPIGYRLMLAAAPAAPEVALSSDERVAALCDLSYRAGLKAGWNYCAEGDETGFARSMESARGAVAVLAEHRQKGAPAAPAVQGEPVATVVERKEGSRTWFEGVIHATAIVMEQIKDGDLLYAAPPAQPDASVLSILRDARESVDYHKGMQDLGHETGKRHAAELASLIERIDAALAGKGGGE